MANILIVDDVGRQLDELRDAVDKELGNQVEIRAWRPTRDENPEAEFQKKVDESTVLVITDYDLTEAQTGLFGSAIVGWCQRKFIPVGDFSRGNKAALPAEPNQYEIRVPTDPDRAPKYVASLYSGFHAIRTTIESEWDVVSAKKSPSAVLAHILSREDEESRFLLYSSKLGTANAALMEEISGSEDPTANDKRRLLAYVVGHLLLNSVLRFPGPIIDGRALAAFLAISGAELPRVEHLFNAAKYEGPFREIDRFYWFSAIDSVLDELAREDPEETEVETIGQLNREAIERKLGVVLARHECPRCGGINGGFLCPFTSKTVCTRQDCSVMSNAWIPQGARLSRIEKDFYDEWAPMLGF